MIPLSKIKQNFTRSITFLWRRRRLCLLLAIVGYALSVYVNYKLTDLTPAEFLWARGVPEGALEAFNIPGSNNYDSIINDDSWEEQLANLRFANVTTENPTRYNRDQWPLWSDADRDCRDTRAEILIGASITPATTSADGCRVFHGMWRDHWDGRIITDLELVHIDHLVPLYQAHHRAPAHYWTPERREEFANNYRNLSIMYGPSNADKAAQTPLQWLPGRNQCRYLYAWVDVKRRYQLSITRMEYNGLLRLHRQHC